MMVYLDDASLNSSWFRRNYMPLVIFKSLVIRIKFLIRNLVWDVLEYVAALVRIKTTSYNKFPYPDWKTIYYIPAANVPNKLKTTYYGVYGTPKAW